jgi:heavy metal efflux system protein
VAVFLPLFTLEGVEGKTFRPLAYTVALAMAGSLVYALLVAPAFSDLVMRRRKPDRRPVTRKEALPVRALLVVYEPVVRLFVRVRALGVALAAVLIAVGLLVFPRLGSEFAPALEEGTIVVRLTMAPSISLEQSKQTTMAMERRLLTVPEVEQVVTRIGRGEVGAHADPTNSAEMFVGLVPERRMAIGARSRGVGGRVCATRIGQCAGRRRQFHATDRDVRRRTP